MSSSAIGRRIASGRWRIVLPSVYLVSGMELSSDILLMAAVLWGGEGALASCRAAARLWDLGIADDFFRPEITTPRHLASEQAIVHQGHIPRTHRTVIGGIPVTSIHRTLMDLGDVMGESQVQDALDCALRRRMTSAQWLSTELDRTGISGRKGAAMLKRLLVGDTSRPSWLERRFIRLLIAEKLGGYVREHHCGPYRIDFAWLDVKLGVEVHGEKWHLRRARWSADLTRHNRLTAAGWTMLHFDWTQIKLDPVEVIREIRETRSRLERRFVV